MTNQANDNGKNPQVQTPVSNDKSQMDVLKRLLEYHAAQVKIIKQEMVRLSKTK